MKGLKLIGVDELNPVLETIHKRTSLRRYKDTPISDEHLKTLLEATLRAPTAGNMMLYSVLTIKDQAMKEKLSQTCDNQPFIARAPLVLVFLADYQRWFDYYRMSGVALLRELDVGDLFLAMDDAIIAAQTAVLAAESMGIGTCYIGDVMENYDGTRTEPRVLPSPIPNLLLNGATGIAVGMATNIPPHNLNEICNALIYLIDQRKFLNLFKDQIFLQKALYSINKQSNLRICRVRVLL